MKITEIISTPWAPYALQFSNDGSRLAIGGGSWYGNGGIKIVDLKSGESELFSFGYSQSAPNRPNGIPAVSGLCLSGDDRHLVASTRASRFSFSPIWLFELDGLRLEERKIFEDPGEERSFRQCPTGILFHKKHIILRSNSHKLEEVISSYPLDPSLNIQTQGVRQHLSHNKLIILDDHILTGGGGSLKLATFRAETGFQQQESGKAAGGLVVAKYQDKAEKSFVMAAPSKRTTAIAYHPSGQGFTTGGLDGEIDFWREEESWVQDRLRNPQPKRGQVVRGNIEATYRNESITAICHLYREGPTIAVDASGEVLFFWENELVEQFQLPEAGSPRSLAAHPHKNQFAVGLKQGGFGMPKSAVVLVDV
jgi:WD40 repeat protein